MSRLLRHLLHTPLATRRAIPPALQENLRRAVHDSEQTHRGEIRVVVEGDWPIADVLTGKTVRQRALDVFGLTRTWDTADNNGVMIYVLLCERRVEILADRGIHARVGDAAWQRVCTTLTAALASGDFENGLLAAIAAIGTILAEHFPATGSRRNELPDLPVVWR